MTKFDAFAKQYIKNNHQILNENEPAPEAIDKWVQKQIKGYMASFGIPREKLAPLLENIFNELRRNKITEMGRALKLVRGAINDLRDADPEHVKSFGTKADQEKRKQVKMDPNDLYNPQNPYSSGTGTNYGVE